MKVQRAAELCHFHPSLPRVGLPLLSRQKQSEEMSGEALTAAAAAAEEDDEIETEYDKIGRRGRERGEIGEG